MKSLYIYHRKKQGFEKYEFIQDVDKLYPEKFLAESFQNLYNTTPTIKYYDMPVKINQVKFSYMFVAFDNGNELILAERIQPKTTTENENKCFFCGHESEGLTVFRTIWFDSSRMEISDGFRTHLTINEKYELCTIPSVPITICANRSVCQYRQIYKN